MLPWDRKTASLFLEHQRPSIRVARECGEPQLTWSFRNQKLIAIYKRRVIMEAYDRDMEFGSYSIVLQNEKIISIMHDNDMV